ncbi:hypothetical protein IAU59_007025 [Kwoniella sp. CBS 9459]
MVSTSNYKSAQPALGPSYSHPTSSLRSDRDLGPNSNKHQDQIQKARTKRTHAKAKAKAEAQEAHLLYVLLDSNLPTGGFVSSSGLESYAKHGFFTPTRPTYLNASAGTATASAGTGTGTGTGFSSSTSSGSAGGPSTSANTTTRTEKRRSIAQGVTEFAWNEVGNYSSTTSGFVRDAWTVTDGSLERYMRSQARARAKARERRRGAIRRSTDNGHGHGNGHRLSQDQNHRPHAHPNTNAGQGEAISGMVNAEPKMDPNLNVETLVEKTVEVIQRLDQYHESTLLSHVGRRSSKAQGVAMLTLYSRGLSRPAGLDEESYLDLDHDFDVDNNELEDDDDEPDANGDGDGDEDGYQDHETQISGAEAGAGAGGENHFTNDTDENAKTNEDGDEERMIGNTNAAAAAREEMASMIVERYKRSIRKGETPGHLAVCWGVMTAALGLSLDRSIHLHLFLHARSLLSSAVRLNLIGPYLSSQLLLHPFRGIIDRHVEGLISPNGSMRDCSTGLVDQDQGQGQDVDSLFDLDHEVQEGLERSVDVFNGASDPRAIHDHDEDAFWSWTEEAERGPASTWPLGEILMSRHDLQHSRIFNS